MTYLIISQVVVAIIAAGAIAGIIKMPKKSKIVPIIALIICFIVSLLIWVV